MLLLLLYYYVVFFPETTTKAKRAWIRSARLSFLIQALIPIKNVRLFRFAFLSPPTRESRNGSTTMREAKKRSQEEEEEDAKGAEVTRCEGTMTILALMLAEFREIVGRPRLAGLECKEN